MDFTHDNSSIDSAIQSLIKTNHDAAKGFAFAAEKSHDSKLSTLLNNESQTRRQFANTLEEEARRVGANGEANDHLLAKMHRGWISIREKLSSSDHSDNKILEECLRGENSAAETYHSALQEKLPPTLRSALVDQKAQIEQTIAQLQSIQSASQTN